MLKVSFASNLQPLPSTIHPEQITTPLQIEFELFWRIHASRMLCNEEIECDTAEYRVGTIEIGGPLTLRITIPRSQMPLGIKFEFIRSLLACRMPLRRIEREETRMGASNGSDWNRSKFFSGSTMIPRRLSAWNGIYLLADPQKPTLTQFAVPAFRDSNCSLLFTNPTSFLKISKSFAEAAHAPELELTEETMVWYTGVDLESWNGAVRLQSTPCPRWIGWNPFWKA